MFAPYRTLITGANKSGDLNMTFWQSLWRGHLCFFADQGMLGATNIMACQTRSSVQGGWQMSRNQETWAAQEHEHSATHYEYETDQTTKQTCQTGIANPAEMFPQTHTGKNPFRCEVCWRTFNHKMNLKIHLRIHSGETPYKCEICSRNFRHLNSYKRHKLTAHSN